MNYKLSEEIKRIAGISLNEAYTPKSFSLEFDMENDAFSGDWRSEAARALRDVAKRIESGKDVSKVMDSNGNSIGKVDY
jgi:hypothetical protein